VALQHKRAADKNSKNIVHIRFLAQKKHYLPKLTKNIWLLTIK
jgi:hypothetical protein